MQARWVLLLVASGLLAACQPAVSTLPTLAPTAAAQNSPEPSATATPAPTLPPTFTPAGGQAAPEDDPTPSATALPTRQATPTLRPTYTTTSTPVTPTGTPIPIAEGLPTPPTTVPTAVPTIENPPGVTNILLLGNDVGALQGGRTDTIIIVSINETTKTASLLNLPRDLYVYIPEWTMNRINTALPHGYGVNYPGGGGQLLKDTILYNFGISVDYYVRIGFDGFKAAVEALDGIEVAVSCQLEDWRLKSPEYDPNVEDNWEMFTLEPGVYSMDGDLALWYARSRRTSNDFERNRRQQQVLRAMLSKGLDLGLLPQAPALWESYRETVETDLDFATMVRLAALAPAVKENGIQHLNLPRDAMRSWRVPDTGAAVLLPQWEAAAPTLQQLVLPPALNRATRPPIYVEVVTGDGILYRLAAENLAWYGFVPVYAANSGSTPATTQINYYAPTFKGSFDWLLSWIFGRPSSEINLVTDEQPNNIDYRVTLGWDYDPCLSQFNFPQFPEN